MKLLRNTLLTLAVCLTLSKTAFCDALYKPSLGSEHPIALIAVLLVLICVAVTILLIVRHRKMK